MRKMIGAAMLAGGTMLSGAALGDAREDVVSGMTRCASVTEDRQWLECYYGAAQPMRAWLGLPPAPQSQLRLLQGQPQPQASVAAPLPATVTRAAVRSGPPPMPKKSGLFDLMGGNDVVKNQPVQSYDVSGKDGFTITLPDGQVWKQTPGDAEKNPVRWREPASSMRVSVSQGAMHSFNLVVNDENQHYKVTRIR